MRISGPINIRSIVPADAPVWESMRRHLWPDGADDHAPEIARFFAGTLQELSAVLVAETLQRGLRISRLRFNSRSRPLRRIAVGAAYAS
jgi:hypothetical protein